MKSPIKAFADLLGLHDIIARLFLPRGVNARSRARRSAIQVIRSFQALEPRALLSITANNANYSASSATQLAVSAPGLLADCTDTGGYQMTAHLLSGPSAGTLIINGDGSFTYNANGFTGTTVAEWDATDTNGGRSNVATLTFTVSLGVASFTDSTKVAVDTIDVTRPILDDPWGQSITAPLPAGGSGGTVISPEPADGAPATAHNLSLEYNSITASPDQVLEGDAQLAMSEGAQNDITVSATFNGSAAGTSYIATQYLGANPTIHVAVQVSTAGLATGYYPYTLTLSGSSLYAPATISGYAAVVNNSASPFGAGWDMPGLDHLYQNNVSGAPAGMLLTDGSGEGWFFTAPVSGNTYTSPAGPYAFDTLTSLSGGGWQLVDKFGTTFTFNSSGYLTSREERTTQTTDYNWTNGLLTSIVDPFSRAVDLSYTNGLLASITDFAGSVWDFGMTSGQLTAIGEPNPGYSMHLDVQLVRRVGHVHRQHGQGVESHLRHLWRCS